MSFVTGPSPTRTFRALRLCPQAAASALGFCRNQSPSLSSSPWLATTSVFHDLPSSQARLSSTKTTRKAKKPTSPPKPPVVKKKGQPLEYSQIPRSLTHDRQEPSPYGSNRYRAVIIDHLPPETTLTDLTLSIARTAPVGSITSITLLPPPRIVSNGIDLGLGAHVVFGRYQAATALAQAARAGNFRVSTTSPGAEEVVPTVSRDKRVAYHWNNARRIDSRVVLVRGRPGTPGFSEEGVRAAMLADEDALGRAGPLGVECEPVLRYSVDDGCETLEWRFFSTQQASAMRLAVERHFGERLEVYKGHDPCWVDEENGIVPERLNREQAWRND